MAPSWKHLAQRMRSSLVIGLVFSLAGLLSYWTSFKKVAIGFIAVVGIMASIEWVAMTRKKEDGAISALGWFFLVSGLVSWGVIAVQGGWTHIFFVLCVCIFSDTIAYFAGNMLGGPKIFPKISPGKTWSGSLSALTLSPIFTAFLGYALGGHRISSLLLPCFLMGLSAQAGDLLESAAKRFYGVKDSGSLFPGHGGILDRIDSWLGAAIVFVLIRSILLL